MSSQMSLRTPIVRNELTGNHFKKPKNGLDGFQFVRKALHATMRLLKRLVAIFFLHMVLFPGACHMQSIYVIGIWFLRLLSELLFISIIRGNIFSPNVFISRSQSWPHSIYLCYWILPRKNIEKLSLIPGITLWTFIYKHHHQNSDENINNQDLYLRYNVEVIFYESDCQRTDMRKPATELTQTQTWFMSGESNFKQWKLHANKSRNARGQVLNK